MGVAELLGRIDFRDVDAWPDETLGRYLVAIRLGAEAEARGRSALSINHGIAEKWTAFILKQEASRITDVPLERAIYFAFKGEFRKAGQMWRSHMLDSAQRMNEATAYFNEKSRIEKHRTASAKGGLLRHQNNDTSKRVEKEWNRLAKSGVEERSRATMIAKTLDLTRQTVGTHIVRLGLKKANGNAP